MKSLSIRWRLTAYYSAFTFLILTALSSLVLWRVYCHLLERADQSLVEEANELAEELQYFDDRKSLVEELQRRYSVHSHYHFQVLDENLEIIFQSRFLTNLLLPPSEFPGKMRGKQFANIKLSELGHFRLLNMAIRDSHARPMMMRTLLSRSELEQDFQSYIWMLLALLPIAFVTTLVAGYVLAGNLLSPIKRINSIVRQITASRLHERLPISNPDDEIGDLSIALNETFDRLEKSMSSMRRFTSDAAHELRSPVAVLRTEAEIALRKPRSVDEYQRVVSTTLQETIRLGAIVDQLLTLSRHDAGVQMLLTDEVPVGAILQDVLSRCESLAKEKGIAIDAQTFPDCFTLGHDVWLSQLFFNLLENAIKFTPGGGQVTITADLQVDRIEVQVKDNGIGISASHLPLVFERFYRADESREHYRGTGLGLSICKSIVEAHRGTIEIASELGIGTEIKVVLPVLPNETDPLQSESIAYRSRRTVEVKT